MKNWRLVKVYPFDSECCDLVIVYDDCGEVYINHSLYKLQLKKIIT